MKEILLFALAAAALIGVAACGASSPQLPSPSLIFYGQTDLGLFQEVRLPDGTVCVYAKAHGYHDPAISCDFSKRRE